MADLNAAGMSVYTPKFLNLANFFLTSLRYRDTVILRFLTNRGCKISLAYGGTLGTSLFRNSIAGSPFLPFQYGYSKLQQLLPFPTQYDPTRQSKR